MNIQIQYRKDTNKIVSFSRGTTKLNIGKNLGNKVLTTTVDDFNKLSNYGYESFYKSNKIIFKDRDNILKDKDNKIKQKEFVNKLKDKKITDDERDELLLLLLNK